MRVQGARAPRCTRGHGYIDGSAGIIRACRGCGYHAVTDRFRCLCAKCGSYAQLRMVIDEALTVLRGDV